MSSVVFDASTLLISINREPGLQAVSAIEDKIVISSVNYAEIVTKLALGRMSPEAIEDAVAEYPVTIVPFTQRLAMIAGLLVSRTRDRGLSLGDRACLALAMDLKLPVVTADRAWAALDLGVEIRQVR
jgi:PIN domain nuclease of toxin-antitoxin system